MIGAPRIGASGAVRPFYNRGGGPRFNIGTVVDSAILTNATTSLAIPPIPANAFLLVATTYNNFGAYGAIDPVLVTAGITLTLAAFEPYAADNCTFIWVRYGGALASDTLTWTWPVTNPDFAAFGCYVMGLGGTIDLSSVNAGTSTTQNSNATGSVTAPAYGMGAIGTAGRVSDTVGTWGDGAIGQPPNVVAVASAGTPSLNGVQLKVAELIIAANQQMSMGVTGATSRNFGAITQAFR